MSDSAPLVASIRSLPRMSRTPTRNCWAFLKLCNIGSMSSAPRHSSASVASRNSNVGSLSSNRPSISSSSMPGLLIRMPDRYWLDEHSSTYKCSVGGLKLNSSHSTPLPPSESLTLLRLTSVKSGSGVAAMACKQLRRDGRQKMPAAAGREKADLLGRQFHQVLVGLRERRGSGSAPAPRRCAPAAARDRAPGRSRARFACRR